MNVIQEQNHDGSPAAVSAGTLGWWACLAVKLQKQSSDILLAYQVSAVQLELKEMLRMNCEVGFHLWFEEVTAFARDLYIAILLAQEFVQAVFAL